MSTLWELVGDDNRIYEALNLLQLLVKRRRYSHPEAFRELQKLERMIEYPGWDDADNFRLRIKIIYLLNLLE